MLSKAAHDKVVLGWFDVRDAIDRLVKEAALEAVQGGQHD
jgi:hypothetical protein